MLVTIILKLLLLFDQINKNSNTLIFLAISLSKLKDRLESLTYSNKKLLQEIIKAELYSLDSNHFISEVLINFVIHLSGITNNIILIQKLVSWSTDKHRKYYLSYDQPEIIDIHNKELYLPDLFDRIIGVYKKLEKELNVELLKSQEIIHAQQTINDLRTILDTFSLFVEQTQLQLPQKKKEITLFLTQIIRFLKQIEEHLLVIDRLNRNVIEWYGLYYEQLRTTSKPNC